MNAKNIKKFIPYIIATVLAAAAVVVLIYVCRVPRLFSARAGLSNTVGSSASLNAGQIVYGSIHNNEYIIVWDEKVPENTRRARVLGLEGFEISEEFDDIYMVVRNDSLTVTEILDLLKGLEGVKAADPNYIMTAESLEGDTYSGGLWGLDNTGFYSYYDLNAGSFVTLPIHPDIDINYPEALDLYGTMVAEPEPVVVAVIDTGVDISHPDLADMIWVNEGEIPGDGIDNDGNGYIDDYYGWDFYNNDNTVCHYETDVDGVFLDNDNHGTKVAGIIAARAGNAQGIAGVASMAPVKIMVIKMNGGSRSYGTVSNAIKAVNYATAMGADICNMSWGIQKSSKNDSTAMLDSLRTAMERSDMLFVCAAGNTGTSNDEFPVYPASFGLSNSISVTWCNQFGKLIVPTEGSAEGSCYGSSVDLAAPGVYILSTSVGGKYAADSGSSMATPYVSGIAAVLMSTGKNLYPSEIKDLIISTRKLAPDDGTEYAPSGTSSASGAPSGSGSTLPASAPENPFDEMIGKVRYPGIPDLYAALAATGTLLGDPDPPVVDVSRDFEDNVILLSIIAKDPVSGIRTIRYALEDPENGEEKDASFFLRGILGTPYTEALRLSTGGVYSIYVSDYAGNEVVIRYDLKDDVTPPKIDLLNTKVSPSGTTLAVFDVTDLESRLFRFLILPGEFTTAQFADNISSAATLTPIDGRLLLRLNGAGTYTLYAIDGRGNAASYQLTIK